MKTLISTATIAIILGASGATSLAQGRVPTAPGGPAPGPGYRPSYPPAFVVDGRGDPRTGARYVTPPREVYPPFVVTPEYRRVPRPQPPCPPPPHFGRPVGGFLRFVFNL